MAALNAEQFIQRGCIEIEIPGFVPGELLTILVRRASLTSLASSGKIPNVLMSKVMTLFEGKDEAGNKVGVGELATKEMDNVGKIMDIMCEACMIQPKYSEVRDYMTDDQKSVIFGWSQSGVTDLSPTDNEPRDPRRVAHIASV